MSIKLSQRLIPVVLFAGFMLPAAALTAQPSHAAPPAAAVQDAQITPARVADSDAETIANFKQVLAQYGNFVNLARYGEVWVPTVTPEGWHPYPPWGGRASWGRFHWAETDEMLSLKNRKRRLETELSTVRQEPLKLLSWHMVVFTPVGTRTEENVSLKALPT